MPERVIDRFRPDRRIYLRDHVIMAAVAAVGIAVVLVLMGNDHVWVALVAAPAAIAVRGVYLASEELAAEWRLTDRDLSGPGGRQVPLADLALVRHFGSAVQLITRAGDKHLLKYQANPAGVRDRIEAQRRK